VDFGKRIKYESYFQGVLKSTRTEYSVPELIRDKSHALSEIMKCLELISTKQTHDMTIVVKADPKTGEIKMITKTYTIEE